YQLRHPTGEPCNELAPSARRCCTPREGEFLPEFYKPWRAACEAAKVPGRLLHDMRRTAIRNLVRAGGSDRGAIQIRGHKTRSIFDRYNITSERDLRDAAALLSAHHKALMRHRQPSGRRPGAKTPT